MSAHACGHCCGRACGVWRSLYCLDCSSWDPELIVFTSRCQPMIHCNCMFQLLSLLLWLQHVQCCDIYIHIPITACVYNNISIKHVRNVVCAYNWFIRATMYSSDVCLVHGIHACIVYMYPMYLCVCVCVCTCVHVQSIPAFQITPLQLTVFTTSRFLPLKCTALIN